MPEADYRRNVQVGGLSRRRLIGAFATGGAGLASLALSGCRGRRTGQLGANRSSSATTAVATPRPGGMLNVVNPFNPILDPDTSTTRNMIGGVFSRLLRFKAGPDPQTVANLDVENELAVSVESPDAITWTVKLRPDAQFHDIPPVNGHPVEAEDIKATFTRFVSEPRNPSRGLLGMVDPAQIQTPSKDTVIFKLRYAYAPFLKGMASGAYGFIFPREALAGSYEPLKQMIGSGPFVEKSYQPDVALVYQKHPNYFEHGRPYVDGLRVAIVPDTAQQLAQFTAGNLDEVQPAFSDLETVKRQNPRAVLLSGPVLQANPIYFQLGDRASVFQDVRVRRAFSMALDRAALGKAVFGGPVQELVFVPSTLGKWALRVDQLDPSIGQYYKYNPAKAKSLLQAAGVTNLNLKFLYPANGPFSTPSFRALYEAIANMLGAVGVKLIGVDQDYAKDFVDAGKGSRQGYFDRDSIIFGSASAYTDADEFLFNYFHSTSTTNQEHLSDPALDAMIDKERATITENERLKAATDIQKYIAEQMYAIATVGPLTYTVVQPYVKNYRVGSQYGKFSEAYDQLWIEK